MACTMAGMADRQAESGLESRKWPKTTIFQCFEDLQPILADVILF
jgi:hypothetical protein